MSRIKGLAGVFLVGGVVLLGCTEATPDYCQKSTDCTGGRVCDVARAVCVTVDGAAGLLDALPGVDVSADRAINAPNVGEAGTPVDVFATEAAVAVDVSSAIDAAEVDAPIDTSVIEVPGPDVNVPDGAGTCGVNGDCSDPTKVFCVGGMCVGCQAGLDGGTNACGTQVCDVASGRCVECTVDSQCTKDAAKGFCVANACSGCTDAETLYVANVTGCAASGTTGGTSSQPLCGLQAAVTLMGTNTSKHLVVLRSPSDVVAVTNATQVSIVGQNTASIGTGVSNAGITLSGTGNLYARDLSVIGNSVSNVGISAGTGTTLRLDVFHDDAAIAFNFGGRKHRHQMGGMHARENLRFHLQRARIDGVSSLQWQGLDHPRLLRPAQGCKIDRPLSWGGEALQEGIGPVAGRIYV
jgi:hypothetical protein